MGDILTVRRGNQMEIPTLVVSITEKTPTSPAETVSRPESTGTYGQHYAGFALYQGRSLAAVDDVMADVLALDEVDDIFGDVGRVVADAFEIFGDEDQFERGEDDARIAHHVGK